MKTKHSLRSSRAPRRRFVCLVAAAGILNACGGGGRGAEAPAPASSSTTSDTDDMNRMILAAAQDPSLAPGATSTAEYVVGPGDRLRVDVFGAERFSGVFPVDESGAISMPLLGSVATGGQTLREVEDLLEARLRETYMRDPHVTAQVEEMLSRGVSVLGAVARPGVYQVTGRSSLLDVLAMAGGLSEGAGSTVFIRRGGRAPVVADPTFAAAGVDPSAPEGAVVEVDLGRLLWSGSPEENVTVHPGDIVQVRTASLVYVVGEVVRPGGYTVPLGESMTVLQAIAMAEGLGSTAAGGSSMIVREHSDGTREEIAVDLNDVLDGSATPPKLEPNDVLFVPNNATKSFAISAVNTLVRMVTFRGLIY